MSKDTGGPAFPVSYDHDTFQPSRVDEAKRLMSGMDLRDYFAAKAMHGTMAAMDSGERNYTPPETIAKNAYDLADAMLAARVKP